MVDQPGLVVTHFESVFGVCAADCFADRLAACLCLIAYMKFLVFNETHVLFTDKQLVIVFNNWL